MPPTADEYRAGLLALQQQQRASLTSLIEQVDGTLAYDWQRGMGAASKLYGPLLDQYARDLAALRAEADDPSARLTLDWLTSRNAQLATIQQSIAASAEKYGQTAAETVTQAQSTVAEMAASDAAQLTQRSLWPAVEGAGVPPSVLFNRPNPDAIAQWVGRAGNGHPLGDLFSGFGAEATQGARQAMMLGLLTGANPKAMATGIANALGVSRSRATIISRTEVLGSYRSAAHETYRANSDVLNGWMWSAGGANPCAMCMGMDGLTFSLSEELVDHPCGKCAPLPVTKTWDDILGPLGIDTSDMEETSMGAPGAYETGPEKFARMSPQQQRAIIGTKTGYEAYRRGEVELKDFIGTRPAEGGFPAMPYQKSLREMEIPTGRAGTPLVERSPRLTELERAGNLRARDFGAKIEPDEMPRWAQKSPASQVVYQIMRNGLPWNMSQHELPLLSANIDKMLTEDLSLNVRMAALRLQDMLKQYDTYLERYVRNVTSGASTLGRAPEFVYKPSKELERALAAARAGERAGLEAVQVAGSDLKQTANREAIQEADAAIKDEIGRAATHIAPEDVAKWTANNADGVPSIAYHAFRSETDFQNVLREGMDLNEAAARSAERGFLRGLYMTEAPLTQDNIGADLASIYGQSHMPLAIHMENPLILSKDEWPNLVNEIISGMPNGEWRAVHAADDAFFQEYQQAFRDYLDKHGYDGVIRDTGMTGNPLIDREVIAFKPGTVRVIDEAAARAGERGVVEKAVEDVGRIGARIRATVSDETFERATIDAIRAHDNGSGFAHIRDVRNDVMQKTGISRKEFTERFNAMRDLGDSGAGRYELHFEPNEDNWRNYTGKPSMYTHTWNGQPYDFVAIAGDRETGFRVGGGFSPAEAADVTTTATQDMIEADAVVARSGSAIVGESVDTLRDEAERMSELFDAENAYASAAESKAEVSHALATALSDNPHWQRVISALSVKNGDEAASELLKQWALGVGSVNDEHRALYVAIHQAIKEEFGLDSVLRSPVEDIALADKYFGEVQPGLQAFMREMYDQTQAKFDEEGISDIALYRGRQWNPGQQPEGYAWDNAAHEGVFVLQPGASFSTSGIEAYNFGGGSSTYADRYQMLMGSRVAVRDILSTPLTGFGAKDEAEMVVLGRPIDGLIFTGYVPEGGSPFLEGRIYQQMADASKALEAAQTTEAAAQAGAQANKVSRILKQIDGDTP